MANDHPVILCHGIFGWGPAEAAGFPYWGIARSVPSPLRRREASVGPISSMHDRACELAFQIKGGRVDYGEEHSQQAGHHRFGRTYGAGTALYPQWSDDFPVHLVGHSMGGPTIWLLQHMLATDFFGWGSSERWVTSVNSISGVLNGTTATYFLGCDEQTGLIAEDGIGDFLSRAIELHIRAMGDLFERFYDFDLDHWDIAAPREGLGVYMDRIARSPLFRGTDNGAYSLTIQGMLEQNVLCRTYPETYYFSYVTEQTFRGFLSGHHYPEPGMNPFLIPTALYIGHSNFNRPFYPGFHAPDWWPNDGLVSVYSQQYPRIAGGHPVGGDIAAQAQVAPGAWFYEVEEGADHIDIVTLPELGFIGSQKKFYARLFQRLAAL